MKTYEIESDGRKFTFNVVKDTTKPCPQCGVPACGREDIIWYEIEDQRFAIIFDGGYFDLAGEEFFSKYLKSNSYETLPVFMKEWNESEGWENCWDYNGYELQTDDFLTSMELLKLCKSGKWILKEKIEDMQKLALEAQKNDAKLKIVRG